MVELTYGGTWLKWSSLDRVDRNWAILSIVASSVAALPAAVRAAEWGYGLGFRAGAGRPLEASPFTALLTSEAFAYAALASVALAIISGFAWWRFSRHQDEMFNAIQNYAIAQASGWTFAFVLGWWMLSLGGWVGALPLAAIVVIGTVLLLGFWFYAVRKWA